MYLILQLILWPLRFAAKNFRALFAALLGYSIIGIAHVAIMSGATRALDAERLLHAESWEASAGWITATLIATAAGAFGGGSLCQLVDKRGRGIRFLTAYLVVYCIVALLSSSGPEPTLLRQGTPTLVELVGSTVVRPLWVEVCQTLGAAAAVLFAGRMVRHRQEWTATGGES